MEQNLISTIAASDLGQYVLAGSIILNAIILIASTIAPFTKTPKDDEAVAWLKALVQRFAFTKPKV